MFLRNAIRFLNDRRGNIAPIFALSLIPTVGMIGAAVDYTRANSVQASLQASLDATTLAMAKSAQTLNADALTSSATAYFNAVFQKASATTGVQLTINYTTAGGPKLVMSGATSVKTQFMNLPGLGIPYITVKASSTSKWSNSRLRVALALDNTGSMASSGKMTALKTASKNLIDQLSAASMTDGDVYVSIIPFSRDVNVGTGNVNASWLRWSGGTNPDGTAATDSWDDLNGACSKSGANNRTACLAKGTCSISTNTTQNSCNSAGTCSISGYTSQNSCTSNGVCSKSWKTTPSSCSSAGGTWTSGQWTSATWTPATWTPAAHSTWTGCVMDRDQAFDTTNAAPSPGTPGTLFPTEQYSDCPVEIMPLNNNWANLKTKIDSMVSKGNTNTTIGLEWAWHSLTAGSPLFAPPEDSNYDYKKVIIFLTDGDNTENRFTSNQTSIDDRMKLACANAKNSASVNGNVEIYTILVIQGTASLLEDCSSNKSDHYFKITSANQLVSVFSQIGSKLARLHVAK
jgi:Flp pilus assembly protein TadG